MTFFEKNPGQPLELGVHKDEPSEIRLKEDGSEGTKTSIRAQRRAPRLDIAHFKPLVCICYPGARPELFRVRYITEYGAGFDPRNVRFKSDTAGFSETQLNIGKIGIPLKSRIVHAGANLAGVEFSDPSGKAQFAIKVHFFAEQLATLMQAKTADYPTPQGSLKKTSYAGKADRADIYFEDNKLYGFKLDLDTLGTKARWQIGGELVVNGRPAEKVSDDLQLLALTGFLRNLSGLNFNLRRSAELVLSGETNAPEVYGPKDTD